MKKRIIILASVFLLTGCSGNTPSDDAPDVTNASSLSNLSGESSQGTPGAEQSGNVRTSEQKMKSCLQLVFWSHP